MLKFPSAALTPGTVATATTLSAALHTENLFRALKMAYTSFRMKLLNDCTLKRCCTLNIHEGIECWNGLSSNSLNITYNLLKITCIIFKKSKVLILEKILGGI